MSGYHFSDFAFEQGLGLRRLYDYCQYQARPHSSICGQELIAISPFSKEVCCEDHYSVFQAEVEMWFQGIVPPDSDRVLPFENLPKVEKECPVCFSKERLVILSCLHTVCFECLEKLNELNCPMCRSEIDVKKIRKI